jgi:DNA polymerase I-like protein with 3'-5' exonuclease and polymerase domains
LIAKSGGPVETHKIDSLKKLHHQLPSILEKINADPQLAIAAAANPLHALEELGYQIDSQVRAEIEDHVRFKPDIITKLRKLREEISKHAGHPFDPNLPAELHRVLFEKLKLPPEEIKREKKEHLAVLTETTPFPPQVSWAPKMTDPLEKLRGKHPIIEPLLEYRRLEASTPRLASKELYNEIRTGKRSTKVVRVRGILKRSPP